MLQLEGWALGVLIRELFQLDASADRIIDARLKHMQRLAFPAGRIGKGQRRTHGIDECLKVAAAFQLVDAGLSSADAVGLLGGHWPTISVAMRQAAREESDATLIAFAPHATADLAGPRGRARRRPVVDLLARGDPLPPMSSFPPSPLVVLDPLLLLSALKQAASRLEGIATGEFDRACRLYGKALSA